MKKYRCLIDTPWTKKDDIYEQNGTWLCRDFDGYLIKYNLQDYPSLFEEVVEPKTVESAHALVRFKGNWSMSSALHTSREAAKNYHCVTMTDIIWPASDYWDEKKKRYILPE